MELSTAFMFLVYRLKGALILVVLLHSTALLINFMIYLFHPAESVHPN